MVDSKALKDIIRQNGYTQSEIAEKLCISNRTFSSKLKRGVLGSEEIEGLIKLLKISNPVSIFFAE